MKPKLLFAGKVSADPETKVSVTGRPYCFFTLEAKGASDKYPTRVRVSANPDKIQGHKAGDFVFVMGDARADAWLGKQDGKPKAALSVWADSITPIGADGDTQVPTQQLAAFASTAARIGKAKREVPPPGSPAAEPDDVPF